MSQIDKIKDRLGEALRMRGMNGADLARACGINKGTIWRYLKGETIPKQNAITRMSQALNVSPAWLLGYELTPEGKPIPKIEYNRLTEENKTRLLAYYQALLDSQEGNRGNPEME